MKRSRPPVIIVVLSLGFGGAEGRMLGIADNILIGQYDKIIFSREVIDRSKNRPDITAKIERLRTKKCLVLTKRCPPIFARFKFALRTWVITQAIIQLLKIRLVHSKAIFHGVLGGNCLLPFAKLGGMSTICEVTSPDNAKQLAKFCKIVNIVSDRIICVSPNVARLCKLHGISGRNIVSTYPVPFYERQSDLNAVYTRSDLYRVNFCARLIERKNGLLFAEAALECIRRGLNIKFSIFGDGPELDKISKLLCDANKQERIFLGRTADPKKEFLESHLFVSLIEPDNYPSQSVLEAMACGNALILSNTGDSAIFLQQGNGLLVELNSKDIADAIESIVSTPIALENMMNSSKVAEEKDFNPELALKFLRDQYSGICVIDGRA